MMTFLQLTTRNLIWLAVTLTIVVGLSWTAYVGMRIRVTYTTQYQLLEMATELRALRDDNRVYHDEQARRLNEIERFVYGTKAAAPMAISAQSTTAPRTLSPAQWQANRDTELRKRIQGLEQRQVNETQELYRRLDAIEKWLQILSRRDGGTP